LRGGVAGGKDARRAGVLHAVRAGRGAFITLLDVYRAIDEPAIFWLSLAEDTPRCPVEQAVNAALEQELREVRVLRMKRFGGLLWRYWRGFWE
jgi:DNA-binding IscR family transcriptional regulator